MMAGSVVRGQRSALVAPFVHMFFVLFCSILVCGDISGVPQSIDRNRYSLDGFLR